MKLCIIGPDKRTQTNLRLLAAAKESFDSVLYVPYSAISISIKDSVRVFYKNINMAGFDAVITRIPKSRSLFGYLITNTLNTYSPINPEAYVITSDRFLMLDMLKRKGLNVPNVYFIDSVRSALDLIEKKEITFPLSMRMPEIDKSMMIANEKKEARTMLGALKTFQKPVYIEELKNETFTEAYVIGEQVVAAFRKKPKEWNDIFSGKGKSKAIEPSKTIEKAAVAAASVINTNFAVVRIIEKNNIIFDINLCPDLMGAIRETGVPVDRLFLKYVAKCALEKKESMTWVSRIFGEAKSRMRGMFE
ncbi:MAG: hypothetical protein HZB66_03310 [Candidatus Aenigmarchaeota archaeon]|nr:hypothetical protein [Candidatus Aenigmarchaeota archaeon]